MTNSGKKMILDLNSMLVSESEDLTRRRVAKFCAERMHEVIAEEWDQEAVDCFKWKQKWEAVLSSSFEMTDNEVLSRGLSYLAAKSSYPNVVNHEQCDRYLRPWIIPVLEITFTTRTDEDECLILASDGLWDFMTNNEFGEVARWILRRKRRSTATNDEPSAA
ncbi:hypothetical protein CTI12_AA176940 [Artemisia annua]|uniref:PPM-type phosphatase domain-containing protein n=1 Tax=Artemisia annua TaxID=35608 RepID=A0A2U1PA65_ARTAN|nr:hypothetical protein CTI12_AA176940 [Artemisia annua]